MKLYLDTCCIQRPLDEKTQQRIIAESNIVLFAFSLCDSIVELVSSTVLLWECENISDYLRRDTAIDFLKKSKLFVPINSEIKTRAEFLASHDIDLLDATHLASAEFIKADLFCTCDDSFLNKAKLIKNLNVKVVSLFELIKELGQ